MAVCLCVLGLIAAIIVHLGGRQRLEGTDSPPPTIAVGQSAAGIARGESKGHVSSGAPQALLSDGSTDPERQEESNREDERRSLRFMGAAVMHSQHGAVLERLASGMIVEGGSRPGVWFPHMNGQSGRSVYVVRERNIHEVDLILVRAILDSMGRLSATECSSVEVISNWIRRIRNLQESAGESVDGNLRYLTDTYDAFVQKDRFLGQMTELPWPNVHSARYSEAVGVLSVYIIENCDEALGKLASGYFVQHIQATGQLPIWKGHGDDRSSARVMSAADAIEADRRVLYPIARFTPDRHSPAGKRVMEHLRVWVARLESQPVNQRAEVSLGLARMVLSGN